MNDSRQIAAQALKALQLRRQLERGDLTQQEYVDQLSELQGATAGPKPLPSAATPAAPTAPKPPKLAPALEALRLRQRLDQGPLGCQAGLSLLQLQPEAPTPPAPKPSLAAPAPVPPRRTRTIEIVTTKPLPERFLTMKCPRCAAALMIYDRTAELQCGDCGAEVVVVRKNFTISLRLAGESSADADPTAITPIAANTGEELQKLRAEAAKVTNVKRAAGLLGGLCTAIFGYAGVSDLASGQTGTGAFILFCGSVLIATVVCITLHTTRVKARLAERIRAINADEEFA